ncbi:sodium-solute symporter [Vibrio ishigakensis]|uniref:Sodium-solute symporter n=1 Tax=Vibrio ishigakensis TaxID=1481914 RepID=A0A0B8NLV9_9VIBR|nr:sodium-solute symporter [Vibrio ishigakensis]
MNGIIGHLVITGGFFCLTTKFYKEPVGERKAELEHFWTDVDTPVVEAAGQDEVDRQQRSMLGKLILVFGALVITMVLIPNILGTHGLPILWRGSAYRGCLLLRSAKATPALNLQTQ